MKHSHSPWAVLLTATLAFTNPSPCLGADAPEPAPTAEEPAPAKAPRKKDHVFPTFGQVERLDPDLDALIPPNAQIEKLAEGFEWSEGPVWSRRDRALYFSDVPRNVVFRWTPQFGTSEFLLPSGYTGSAPRGGEPGSNGLLLDSANRLILCQHGDRRIARLERNGSFTVLAEFYKGRRFNSPNDLVRSKRGNLYFTDPPYGLEKGNRDPRKELVFNGVFLLRPSGEVVLLTDRLSFPNGVALSPDEQTLYVAISDPSRPVIVAYDVLPDGTVDRERVFFDATALSAGRKGLPDGLKVDRKGNLFATGPGGVLVLCPHGRHLGTINTGEATANCAFGGDGSVLYLTADMFLARIQTSTRGLGF